MKRLSVLAIVIGGMAVVFAALSAFSGSALAQQGASQGGAAHPKSSYYRGGASKRRRGGYSYTYEDSINTYGDSRGQYGSADSLRDQQWGRQTDAGPFDHGFFFDSATGQRGGDSPYMN